MKENETRRKSGLPAVDDRRFLIYLIKKFINRFVYPSPTLKWLTTSRRKLKRRRNGIGNEASKNGA